MKQVFLVVNRKRPESPDWRQMAFGKGYSVAILAIQKLTLLVEIGVNVTGFFRQIVEHVRLGGCRSGQVVDAPTRTVRWGRPTVAHGLPVVPELEQWPHQLLLCRDRRLFQGLFELGV